jgi:hypothetical protein
MESGAIWVEPPAVCLSPLLTEGELAGSGVAVAERWARPAELLKALRTEPVLIDGSKFLIDLFFRADRLEETHLILQDRRYDATSWDDGIEEKELARKKAHDEWLGERLGAPPYVYSWGAITSAYNPRDLASRIEVKYRKFAVLP